MTDLGDFEHPDLDLHAMTDQAMAAAKAQIRGGLNGLVLIYEVDGRGLVIGVDHPSDDAAAILIAALESTLEVLRG